MIEDFKVVNVGGGSIVPEEYDTEGSASLRVI